MIVDIKNRPFNDLRISVTDRCNFRCIYCMPKQVFGRDFKFIPHNEMLSFEEIVRVAKAAISLGCQKIRLTGGEPLLRRHLENLIEQLAPLKTFENKPLDLTLTTNGSVLSQKARTLFNAGLKRITVSLDAIDDTIFKRMNDVDFSVKDVLKGIDTALNVGFHPIKVNAVIKKGINDNQVMPLVNYFKNTPIVLRFIEYMDVGSTNQWALSQIVPSQNIIDLIHSYYPLHPLPLRYPGETATRYAYDDNTGEIGVISSVTKAFCENCSRLRLSTDGQLFKCLFARSGNDIKKLLRSNTTDESLIQFIRNIWQSRDNAYSLNRLNGISNVPEQKIEMSYIGG